MINEHVVVIGRYVRSFVLACTRNKKPIRYIAICRGIRYNFNLLKNIISIDYIFFPPQAKRGGLEVLYWSGGDDGDINDRTN